MLKQKMGMNCNGGVNSKEPKWSDPVEGKVFGDVCEELESPFSKDVKLTACQSACKNEVVGCNAIDHVVSSTSAKKKGVCRLLACTKEQLEEGPVDGPGVSLILVPSVNSNNLGPFTDISSWFWTYGLEPEAESLTWGQENQKEFVPLVNLKDPLPNHMKPCTLHDMEAENACTKDQFVEVLKETKKSIKTEYLMGYNEPYAEHGEDTAGQEAYGTKGLKGISGELGAEAWRKVVQPAAEDTGLKLVSPTTGMSPQKAKWLIEFLQACYDKRNSTTFPCDVTKIGVWSIHEYKCYASYWRKYAALDGGNSTSAAGNESCEEELKPETKAMNIYVNFKEQMRRKYKTEEDQKFWSSYIDGVKLWVTETTCSGDNKYNKAMKKTVGTKAPTNIEQCHYITGGDCQREEGSIKAMLGMENIERFSWFTLLPSPPTTHPNYDSIMKGALLNYLDGEPLPLGRAFTNLLDPEACFEA
jgi:hypothetical protein